MPSFNQYPQFITLWNIIVAVILSTDGALGAIIKRPNLRELENNRDIQKKTIYNCYNTTGEILLLDRKQIESSRVQISLK